MTLVTDYVLAVAAAYFAWRLWRASARAWALAFAFTAVGSLAGGTHHGIGPQLHPAINGALWKTAVYAIGLASYFLLTGAIVATTEGVARHTLTLVAVLVFLGYAVWMIGHDDFLFVIANYGASLLALAVLSALAWVRARRPAAPWILASIAVAVVAAVVQQSRVRVHPAFDHNALYHVIQLVSLWLLYRGGFLLMTLATPRPE